MSKLHQKVTFGLYVNVTVNKFYWMELYETKKHRLYLGLCITKRLIHFSP